MGKKRRLNKLISKWIKSDLPEDCSSVLLLGVTRAPPSPKTKKIPFSLPLALGVVSSCSKARVRRNSSGASANGRRPSVIRRDSRRGNVGKEESRGARSPKSNQQKDGLGKENLGLSRSVGSDNGLTLPVHSTSPIWYENGTNRTTERPSCEVKANNNINNNDYKSITSKTSVPPNRAEDYKNCYHFLKKEISSRRSAFLSNGVGTIVEPLPVLKVAGTDQGTVPPVKSLLIKNDSLSTGLASTLRIPTIFITSTKTSSSCVSKLDRLPPRCPSSSPVVGDGSSSTIMQTSVDSIGTCSLDMDSSAELPSDWSEVSSTGTLRSASVLTVTANRQQQQHQHLPSYLSLACTVNGYSTTTNYDSERLTRSRDASPHRVDPGSHLTGPPANISVKNNLLSPPNLVPLPTMTENALHCHHQEFYGSSKTMTFLSSSSTTKESHFTSSVYSTDATDGTLRTIQRKCVTYDTKSVTAVESNGKETKSFIQQRVERLYGPGALAQGFFVSKRQKDRLSESDDSVQCQHQNDKQNKTLPDKLLIDDVPSVRQSSSSPSLPVLRHLRPEFRAQLPIACPRKSAAESSVQKSVTVPELIKDDVKLNGHAEVANAGLKLNGTAVAAPTDVEETGEQDGHHFLKILEDQATRLLALADRTEAELDAPDLPEEVIGKIRSASGKARLLVSQKMQQFKGLCTNNITQAVGEAFPTTNEDLQGFWDMVMLQVDQVDKLFEEIDRLKANNWNEVIVKKTDHKTNGIAKPRKAVSKPKPNVANEEARKLREEQRKKMIEERRKAMKAAQQSRKPNIEIFVPESS